MKFIKSTFKNKLAEIGQQLEVRMAFVHTTKDGHYTNTHPFVNCRDFLGDTLDAIEQKRSNSIYGFTFNPKIQQIIHSNTVLVLEFPNDETYKNLLNNIHYLHDVEQRNKLRKTTVRFMEKNAGKLYAITTGSNFWLKSIFGISLYTFMLKSLALKLDVNKDFLNAIADSKVNYTTWDGKVAERATNEASYANQVYQTLPKLLYKLRALQRGIKSVSGWDTANISVVHNQSGFVSLCSWQPLGNHYGKRIKQLLM